MNSTLFNPLLVQFAESRPELNTRITHIQDTSPFNRHVRKHLERIIEEAQAREFAPNYQRLTDQLEQIHRTIDNAKPQWQKELEAEELASLAKGEAEVEIVEPASERKKRKKHVSARSVGRPELSNARLEFLGIPTTLAGLSDKEDRPAIAAAFAELERLYPVSLFPYLTGIVKDDSEPAPASEVESSSAEEILTDDATEA